MTMTTNITRYYLYPRYINMFTFTYVFARYFINLYMILKIEKITRGNKNVPLEMISIHVHSVLLEENRSELLWWMVTKIK